MVVGLLLLASLFAIYRRGPTWTEPITFEKTVGGTGSDDTRIVNIATKAAETYQSNNKIVWEKSPEMKPDRYTAGSQPKRYLVHWYTVPGFLRLRPESLACDFTHCKYNNCVMTLDKKNAAKSDAVLFDGRTVSSRAEFERPVGQIWIFAAHETPASYMDTGYWWTKPPWRTAFNWTMTYDKSNTDIYLPYGELLKKQNPPRRNFTEIAEKKTKGGLMVNSHCLTRSRREDYAASLLTHADVTILGRCGTRWNCGSAYVHDNCFDILNTTYRFFLAFENAFCHQYFSEKFYDNFNYDIILITRGGNLGDARKMLPKATYISTDDFGTSRELAKYLNYLSRSPRQYASLLKTKSNYYSPGYKYWYERALCDICERLNNQDKYRKHIPDITEWAFQLEPCRNVTDV